MIKRNYTTDSLRHALEHHVAQGRLRAFTHTAGMYRPWFVEGFNGESTTMHDRECSALCYGLASAQYGQAQTETTKKVPE